MKHITIIPNCPKCGNELTGRHKNLPPYTAEHPFGSGVEGWWECCCGYKSETMRRNPYETIKSYTE